MRLTRAGIALLLFLVFACPILSVVSYAALSKTDIGPLKFGADATATQDGQAVTLPTATSVGPASAKPSTGAGSSAPNTGNTTRTPTPNLGVVPLPASAAPSAAASAGAAPGATATRGAASGGPATPLTVAYDAYAPYLPVRIAETQGYYKSRNLAVKQVPFDLNGQNEYSEEERRAALRDGTFDVLLTTLDAVALFGNDQTGKVVAIVDESAGADKIVARAPIARLNDLKGKRITYSEGSVSEFYLYATLNLVGLKASDVQRVPAESVDDAIAKYKAGQADAVVAWEPNVQDALAVPNSKVLLGTDNYRAVLDVMVVSAKALATKPAAVQAFVDAWFEAVKLTTDDPAQAGAAVVKSGDTDWTGVATPQDFPDQLGLVAQATLGQNILALRDASLLGGRLSEAQKVWNANGRQIATVDPAKLIDGSFVQKSNAQGNLGSGKAPVNPTFVLTSAIQLPQLSPEQVGQTQAVAELPLKQIAFEANSAVLSEQGRNDLLTQVVPVLKQTPGLYLRVDGGAAQPLGDTAEANKEFAHQRAQAVIFFLVGQGIDVNRLIEGYIPPQFPGSPNEPELQQDRRVVFTLVQPGGR
jgi:NitT/TauT family transport system substrate-binding protein